MSQTIMPQSSLSVKKWKSYASYKDSGVERVGEIPKQWEVKRLKYIFKVISGSTPKSSESSYWDGNIPWITPEDLGMLTDNLITTTTRTITNLGYQSCGTTLVPVGSLILSTRAPIGHLAIAGTMLCTNQGCRSLVYRNTNNKYFFYYQLLSAKAELHSRGQGSTFLELGKSKLEAISLVVPPIPEQYAIATFLNYHTTKINTLIAKKEQLIELLQEKRAALISQAVTKGLDPTVPMKDSGVEWLGEIPEHWEVKRIKYLAAILRGKFSHRPRNDPRLYNGSYPFIQTGDITAVTKYITDYKQTLNELGFSVSKQFPSGTLVMAIAANIGDLAILQFTACFPDSIVGFVPFSEVSLEYLYYNLMSMKQELMGTATINTQLNINIERIGSLSSVYPPFSEQQSIVSYLDQETAKIDALISRIQDGIKKLKEYSTALISAAVTGKIDVRDVAEESLHGYLGEEP